MVAGHIVDRGDLCYLGGEGAGHLKIRPAPIHQVPGDDHQVRLGGLDCRQEAGIAVTKLLIMQVETCTIRNPRKPWGI